MSWTEQDRPWRAAARDEDAAGDPAAEAAALRAAAETAAEAARRAEEVLERSRREREARARAAEEAARRAPAPLFPAASAPGVPASGTMPGSSETPATPGDVAAPTGGFDPADLSRGAQDPLPDDAPLQGDGAPRMSDSAAGVAAAPSAAQGFGGASGARLTEVIDQRARGLDPNAEAARRRADQAAARARQIRQRARWRMALLSCAFAMAYAAVAGSMAGLASEDPREPRAYDGSAGPIDAVRAEIHDRNGVVLAANLPVHSLFVRRNVLLDPEAAFRGLARIFPDMDREVLRRKLTQGANFQWIDRAITPAERLAVLDLGEPGLDFGPREQRFYPQGRLASHVLGGTQWGEEGELAAEIVGDAGVEAWFDERLRDAARAQEALRLSIDVRVQAALEDVLADAKAKFVARGATGIVMRARTGEILAMASLPNFDPNRRRSFFDPKDGPDDSPLFNRAVQGVYELGSVYKPFTAAMVMDMGMASPESMVETRGPLAIGRFRIGDSHRMPDALPLREVIVRSSNVGTAQWALRAGGERQKAFLTKFGLLDRTPVELPESSTGVPRFPSRWGEVNTATISFGHGVSGTLVNLAAGYAALVNGGLLVHPTLLADPPPPTEADRVIKPLTSVWIRDMLRGVVAERHGTASRAEVPGYEIGGKTGTADKPNGRGYSRDKVIATFASAFPIHDPELVVIVTMDEAEERGGAGKPRRTAGITAAPTVRALVERIAPILGMRPKPMAEPDKPAKPGLVAIRN